MPNVTIYLSAELDERVRQAKLPISQICQDALREAVIAKDEEERTQAYWRARFPKLAGPELD